MVKNYAINESATVCYEDLCVTTNGKVAQIINVIVLAIVAVGLIQAIKNLK
jgi:hypothetical protein